MKQGVSWADVCIRNMSSRGLHLQVSSPPKPGTFVELRRGDYVIVARVIWSREQECGAQTQDVLRIDDIVQNRAPASSSFSVAGRFDRRAVPRTTTAQAHELSRHISAAVQFGFMVLVSLGLAGAAVATVHDALAKPLTLVSASL
jgi:hypothetical protein